MTNSEKISGVALPGTLKAGDDELVLNGVGLRKKLMMKLYAGGLYLNEKKNVDKDIIEENEPMGLRLHIISSMITNNKMQDACIEGFRNATNGDTAPLQNEIDQFTSCFDDQINENDVFDLIYVPGNGVSVFKNEEPKGSIGSFEFKKALFGIWLGDNPADKNLKNAMLGN